jgi:predicted RNA-binding Zn-ribbon protein involved in translation (DUF1610 family)
MEMIIVFALTIVAVLLIFYIIAKPRRCPKCGEVMDSQFSIVNDKEVYSIICPKCGHEEIMGVEI